MRFFVDRNFVIRRMTEAGYVTAKQMLQLHTVTIAAEKE
jgi:membrane carboxypeptidase/penicillin-binding protein